MVDIFLASLLASFASWRIAYFLVNERGPYAIAERIRDAVGVRTSIDPGTGRAYSANEVALAFECVYCLSVWVAIPTTFVVANLFRVEFSLAVLIWLSASAIAIRFNRGL